MNWIKMNRLKYAPARWTSNPFFYFEKNISKKELDGYDRSLTGHHHEGEFLQVQVVKMGDVTRNMNFPVLVEIKLLEKVLKRNF